MSVKQTDEGQKNTKRGSNVNIKEAKTQIKQSVNIYLAKDEYGNYRIPIEKQRPVFLIGPPGIGKTAIMEQIAKDLDIAIVSYSMTHHTRQSALGLPFIVKKNYQGEEYDVSEYTMSEIIASVYENMEKSGKKEGILFLDEINCVSETLAPSMLQFLQYKTFGNHRVLREIPRNTTDPSMNSTWLPWTDLRLWRQRLILMCGKYTQSKKAFIIP